MILVTVGSLFPFDRLIRLADEVAEAMPSERFFAQVGDGAYKPRRMEFARLLSRREFNAKVQEAKVIVAHAGMGSVITAMEAGKPIVLLPRAMEHREHNTDHQMATARWLAGRPGIYVSMTDAELRGRIQQALESGSTTGGMSRAAPEPLLGRIRDFIGSA